MRDWGPSTRPAATLLLLIAASCAPPSDPGAPAAAPPDAAAAAPPPGPAAPAVPAIAEEPAPLVRRARGTGAALRNVTMEVAAAELRGDRLVLELAFENTSDSSYGLAGDLGGEDFLLVEASGAAVHPLAFSPELRRLDAGGGLGPGARKAGPVAFPRPAGDVFELRVPGFEPLALRRSEIAERADLPAAVPGGDRGPPDLDAREPVVAELDRLLAEQASALERYDLEALLATFAEHRRAEEARIGRRLRQLPLVDVGMRVEPGQRPEGDGERRRARVELSFRLDGLSADNPFHHFPTYGFVRRGGRWLVDAIEDDPARPLLWRGGELSVRRTHHFLICTRPPMEADLVELAADAEAAYAELYRRGLPLAPGYLVYFVPSREEFVRLADRPQALGAAVARYVVEDGRTTVDSRAFYVNGPLFSGREEVRSARRATVTHELVHLALATRSRPHTPSWLKEGIAVYFSGGLSFDANRRLVRRGLDRLSLERMTRAGELGEHDLVGQRAADEYLFAGDVVAYLVEQHGLERLLDFYRSFAEVPASEVLRTAVGAALAGPAAPSPTDVAGALAADLTEDALERHYGVGVAELEAAVKEWLSVVHR